LGLIGDGLFLRTAQVLERWAYDKAAYVNAVTEGILARLITKGVPAQKLLFLPNGVDCSLIRPEPPDQLLKASLGLDGKKVALYAGGHGYASGLEQVLSAALLLMEDGDIHFLFIGDGSEKARLVRLAQDLRLRNVTFLDPVPFREISRFMSIADCGLVTLKDSPANDGVRPSKTLAVMASAKPAIFAGKGEGARLVEEARAGIVVPSEQPQALADAVHRVVHNPVLGEQLGRSGRWYVEEKFDWSTLVKSWVKGLAESCADKPVSVAQMARTK
jgi:glycosyltransferase involved in cell wall biosynthesis